MSAQLDLDAAGHGGAVEPGHAAIRFSNPTTGRDALITLRTEMHRLRAGAATAARRVVGSAVWQVFAGSGVAELGDRRIELSAGDLIAVPSWCPLRLRAHTRLDLFTFSDAPVYEALGLFRSEIVSEVGS
jgi:gentisate 1,2-dioxygenase